MSLVKEKNIRVVTLVLGGITTLLISLLGFRLLTDTFARASDIAPKNVTIIDITQNSVHVKWTTDQESQSVIEYGSSPTSLTFFAPEATKTKEHDVELNLLTPDTTYYFQIRTGDKKFDNGGVPWTLTTIGKETAKPTTAPTTTILPTTVTTVSPTTSGPVTKDTACNLAEYKNFFAQSNAKYDQDDNGVVNSHDWSVCKAKNGSLAPSSTPTPNISVTPSPTPQQFVTATPTP